MLARFAIYQISENTSTYWLSDTAIIVGLFFGLIVPFISNIVPIMNALGKNLRSSLDLFHRSVNEMTVSIKKIEDIGISFTQLGIAALLILCGVMTYYFIPSSFIFGYISIFAFLLNSILIFMILGMCVIALLV